MVYELENQISEANLRRLFSELKKEYKKNVRISNDTIGILINPLHKIFQEILMKTIIYTENDNRKTIMARDVMNAMKKKIVLAGEPKSNIMSRAPFVRYIKEILENEKMNFRMTAMAVDTLQAVYEDIALKLISASIVHALEMGMTTITKDHMKMIIRMKKLLC